MKLLYLGLDFDAASDTIKDNNLISWEPPDIEAPIWELHFEDDISVYSDGRMVLVVKGELEELEKSGTKGEKIDGKVTRIKHRTSSDKVLEND